MQRITTPEQNLNSPQHFDEKFNGTFGLWDMDRLERLARYFKGGVYVDVGCFDSIMPVLLAERYPKSKIHALDYAYEMIKFLAARFPKVYYQVGDCYELPYADSSVDYVVAGELIEHLEDPAKFVAEALRVLKPGGWLAISTPLEEDNHNVGGHLHLWRWTRADIEELLGTTNIEVMHGTGSKTILAWRQK